jgi:hypothetical protein
MFIIQSFCAFSNWIASQMRLWQSGPTSILVAFSGSYSLPDQLFAGGSVPTTPPETLTALEKLFKNGMSGLIEAIRGATEGCPQLGRLAQRLDFDGWYTAGAQEEGEAGSLDTPEDDDGGY